MAKPKTMSVDIPVKLITECTDIMNQLEQFNDLSAAERRAKFLKGLAIGKHGAYKILERACMVINLRDKGV